MRSTSRAECASAPANTTYIHLSNDKTSLRKAFRRFGNAQVLRIMFNKTLRQRQSLNVCTHAHGRTHTDACEHTRTHAQALAFISVHASTRRGQRTSFRIGQTAEPKSERAQRAKRNEASFMRVRNHTHTPTHTNSHTNALAHTRTHSTRLHALAPTSRRPAHTTFGQTKCDTCASAPDCKWIRILCAHIYFHAHRQPDISSHARARKLSHVMLNM